MKSKFYWEQQDEASRPFDLPRRISEGINTCRKNMEGDRAPSTVRYIWIYLTDQGLRHGHYASECDCELSLDDWLNIIDESAALGAEWIMMYVGASLSQCPHVWQMCEWAQQTHGLNVGLHLTCNCLSEDDIERLMRLETSQTYLVADETTITSLRFLQDRTIERIGGRRQICICAKRCPDVPNPPTSPASAPTAACLVAGSSSATRNSLSATPAKTGLTPS